VLGFSFTGGHGRSNECWYHREPVSVGTIVTVGNVSGVGCSNCHLELSEVSGDLQDRVLWRSVWP